ncbi:hypothetical protein [Butyricicoccus sp.]|uniref:hypothetical protein n=1 Tax=Butyricicoccus sp. TaxID=2049021 RepID=UPI003736FA10
MKEPLTDELRDSLSEHADAEIQKIRDAVENRTAPPAPPTPAGVARAINRVIDEHAPTSDEMTAASLMRGMTVDEMKLAGARAKEEQTERLNGEPQASEADAHPELPTAADVAQAINQMIDEHIPTAEEMTAASMIRGMTVDEMKLAEELANKD